MHKSRRNVESPSSPLKVIRDIKTVNNEESLLVILKMVLTEIKDGKFNFSRRQIFLNFLKSVDFKIITMMESTWSELITALRFIANYAEQAESDLALESFADIISIRPYDTSTVMALLRPTSEDT